MAEYHPDLLTYNANQFLHHRLLIKKKTSFPAKYNLTSNASFAERVVNRLLNIPSSSVHYWTDKTSEGMEHNLMCECSEAESFILIKLIPQP